MPRLLLYLLVPVCLLACSSPGSRHPGKPGSNGDTTAAHGAGADTDTDATARLAEEQGSGRRFKTLDTALSFAGVWVNEAYFEKIGKTRSPRRSQGIEKSCIVIPDSTLEATNMVGGFHDGGGTMVVVKDGSRYQFYNSELTRPLDTIELISPRRLRIGDQYFRPLEHPDRDKPDWGILEEILFSGKYLDQHGEEVVFSQDGSVRGLAGVSYYEPVIDYTAIEYWQLDQVSLGQSHKKLDDYGFRFDGDTLTIYSIDCLQYNAPAHECDSAVFGEVMWKLRRMPG